MRTSVSRATPHQSFGECARRLRQVKRGQLRGYVKARLGRKASEFVPAEVRYAAIGLVLPSGSDHIVAP